MSVDKLVDSTQLDADLTSVANAIRTKGGTSASLAFPAGFVSAIDAIPTGGGGWTTNDILARIAPSGAIVANNITDIYALFNRNTGITSFKSSTITAIRQDDAFHDCTALTEVELTGAISTMGSYAFMGCTSLLTAKLPNLTANITNGMFRGCTSLGLVDCGKTGQIINNAFNGCSILKTLILRKTSITSLQNIAAFTGTPFASGGSGGDIFAPSSLLNSYKTASNWSTLNGYGTITWKSIEGSIYE